MLNAHSTNFGPIPVLETVILMQLPVLIRRLKEVIVPNFAVDLLLLHCRHIWKSSHGNNNCQRMLFVFIG